MISVHHSNYKTFKQLHIDSVKEYTERRNLKKFSKDRLDTFVLRNFSTLVSNFEELLGASPETLIKIKNEFDGLPQIQRDDIKSQYGLEGLYDRFKNKTDAFIAPDSSTYNSDVLAAKINIGTCPYCNEVPTYSFYYRSDNQYRRTFDWDHILPIDEYPFLAISYFNLVPSCKVCNNLKLNDRLNFNPHFNFNPDNYLEFKISGVSSGILKEASAIKILLLTAKNDMGRSIKESMISSSMNTRLSAQKEMIMDILNKKYIYESELWPSIQRILKIGTDLTYQDIQNLYFGTRNFHEEYFKKPYSKITRDILKSNPT